MLVTVAAAGVSNADTRGLRTVPIKDTEGAQVGLYKGSYALVIGVAEYRQGWPKLSSVVGETAKVQGVLEAAGFSVQRILDPNEQQLKSAIEQFIDEHGYEPDNRLVLFFSGHGYSRKKGAKGYLVPTDAPDPSKDERGFLRKALPMSQVLAWCRQMEAKHALFLFDSCFSGTVFKTKALPKVPPHISAITTRPVRQFIAAGDAGEEVPAKSVFTQCFVRGLEGEADLSKDGYVTGSELGMYLREKVMSYRTGQTPQYGKIRDPELDEGDFVFSLFEVPKEYVMPPETRGVHVRPAPADLTREASVSHPTVAGDAPLKSVADIAALLGGLEGSRILMIGDREGKTDLYVCDYNGANMLQLTHDGHACESPTWGLSESLVMYASSHKGNMDIYSVELGQARRTRIIDHPVDATDPDVSPDGKLMAYISSKDGNPDLYISDLKSGRVTRLTNTEYAEESSPSWSPKGDRIVYASDSSGFPQIYIIGKSGGGAQRVSFTGQRNTEPDWGENGKIAYASRKAMQYQLVVYDPATREHTQVTHDAGDHREPCWAPGGRYVAFTTGPRNDSRICVLDTSKDNTVRVTSLKGSWRSPAWLPASKQTRRGWFR